jgi:hypothetical protein
VASTKPRIQVTVDAELSDALAEIDDMKPRSRALRDLAIRGAEAIREERGVLRDALEHLDRIATGEDDGCDFAVSARLHATR